MKKTLLTCMAVLALFAIAGSASAITCTVDTRPAATLLVPHFSVSLNDDATVKRGTPDSFDTLLAIGNASGAPMLAHVSVWNARSALVLDFMVALTGFDVQSFRMSDILSGNLPSTPVPSDHIPPDGTILEEDACQRNPLAAVYPNPGGYLRVRPLNTTVANPLDNSLATSAYGPAAFLPGSDFGNLVVDSLDETDDARDCGDNTVDGVTLEVARGYVTIDHANYCSLSNPNDPTYYEFNALGGENNLFGDIIVLSGQGIGTYGMNMVAIEQDPSFSGLNQTDALRTRTFYARYWVPSDPAIATCPNCPLGLATDSPWNVLVGDQREPLGLRWAARYFEGPLVGSFFDVWRASSGTLEDLLNGGLCDTSEPTVLLGFFDEDENVVTQIGPGPCPSPCTIPPAEPQNFPLETNRIRASEFELPAPLPGGNAVGWVVMSFVNTIEGTPLDQAWVGYEFDGTEAFISAHFPGIQLDPSACEPLPIQPNGWFSGIDFNPVTPVIPGGIDGLGDPPAGVGPIFTETP
jgi:hypothetical protein